MGVDVSLGLEVVGDLAIEFHLLIGEADVGVEGTFLMWFFGQLVQLRHDLLGVGALDALEGLLTHLRTHSARPSHPIFQHSDAL